MSIRMMVLIALATLFLVMQYQLWFSHGGLKDVMHWKHVIAEQAAKNHQLKEDNARLTADIHDLKSGHQAIEERARSELGMVKKGETFYQVVDLQEKVPVEESDEEVRR